MAAASTDVISPAIRRPTHDEAITAARRMKPTVPSLIWLGGTVLSAADAINTMDTPSTAPASVRRPPATAVGAAPSSANGLPNRPERDRRDEGAAPVMAAESSRWSGL